MIDYGMMNYQSQDHIIKYLLKDTIIVDKTNICGLWTNTRKLQIRDGIVEYLKLNEQQPKMSVLFSNCKSAEYVYSVQDQHYTFTFKFTENCCKLRGQIRNENSQKEIQWKFKTKIKKEEDNIKLKIQQYDRIWLLCYLQLSKNFSAQKQFYQEFSNYCVKSVEDYKKQIYRKDLKIVLLQNSGTNIFKQYQKIANQIQQVRFVHEVYLIAPLYCKVMSGNEVHLCQLLINDQLQQQNELIQQEISQKMEDDNELKAALQNFSVQYYQVENIVKYGLLVSQIASSVENNNALKQDQIKILNQLEAYDTENLISTLHKNKLRIRQLGQILQSDDIKNLDLKKLCLAEICARSLKSILSCKNYDKDYLEEIMKSFLVKPINQNMQDLHSKMEKEINKKFFESNQQFSNIYQKIRKEVPIKEFLIINSLMYHLNFKLPIKINELLIYSEIIKCFDFEKLTIVTRCKTYSGNFPQLQIGEQFNYGCLEYKKTEYLTENRSTYMYMTACYLGYTNSLKAKFLFETNSKMDCNKLDLEKAQQILLQIQPFSPLLEQIKKRLNENQNQEISLLYQESQMKEECQSKLSELERTNKIVEISQLDLQEQSFHQINISLTQSQVTLEKMSDDDIYQYAKEKYLKKRYDHALLILKVIKNKLQKDVLVLGFKCEKQMNIKEKLLFTNLLLNYFFLYQDSADFDLIWDIFKYEMRNIIKHNNNQINFDEDFYFRIYNEQKVCKDYLQVIKKLFKIWFDQKIESLKSYAYQQFGILNEKEGTILIS